MLLHATRKFPLVLVQSHASQRSGHTPQHRRYLGITKQRALTGGTRTCIQTPGIEYTPEDLQPDKVEQILNNASLVYFDGRLTVSAILLAKAARQRGVPVLVEAERLREGLDELLKEADYLCTSAHFPKGNTLFPYLCRCQVQLWTGKATLGDAMLSTLQQLPRLKWMITTLGKPGSVLINRHDPQQHSEEAVLENKLNSMLSSLDSSSSSSSSLASSSRQDEAAKASAADCISKSNVYIRLVILP